MTTETYKRSPIRTPLGISKRQKTAISRGGESTLSLIAMISASKYWAGSGS